MNENNISIDCETLGTDFDAPVVSIGAVAFDIVTGKLGQEFYVEIELKSAIKSGVISGDTLSWWMTQGSKARDMFASGRDKHAVSTSLQMFGDFMRSVGKGVPIPWANGIGQDIAWIEHAYKVGTVGQSVPWHFNSPRDLRTIRDIAYVVADVDPWHLIDTTGVRHNALDDAKNQARVIAMSHQLIMATPAQRKALVDKTVEKLTDDDSF